MSKTQCHSSASAQVLSIPELLCLIFKFSKPKDAASHCRVCQTWFPEAAEIAWREVDDIRRLLKLLAPIKTKNMTIKFTRRLQRKDWDRFDKYASNVHVLDMMPAGFDWGDVTPALSEISRTCPREHVLPNLRNVELAANDRAVVLFGGLNVQQLALSWDESSEDDTETLMALLPYIPSSMPNLVVLDIKLWFAEVEEIEDILEEVLGDLPSLRTIIIPPPWLTPRITCMIASNSLLLEELDTIRDAPDPLNFDEIFQPLSDADSFRSLRTLSLQLSFRRATYCFSRGCSFPSVTSLFLKSSGGESSREYGYLAATIPSVFPNITTLKIHCDDIDDRDDLHVGDLPSRVTFAMLEPLLAYANLRVLELSHTEPFKIDEHELILLLQRMQNLHVLELNPKPLYPRHLPTLSLSSLVAIAPFCKAMQVLRLFLDASNTRTLSRLASTNSLFGCLNVLDFGKSPIEDPDAVSTFLHSILPRGCKLDTSISHAGSKWHTVKTMITEMY